MVKQFVTRAAMVLIVMSSIYVVSPATALTGTARVPAACDAALKVFRSGGANFTDAQESVAERATLDACTRKQWLAGAERYRGKSFNNVLVGNVKATKVLHIFCEGNSDALACS